jgi:hypothetical protein
MSKWMHTIAVIAIVATLGGIAVASPSPYDPGKIVEMKAEAKRTIDAGIIYGATAVAAATGIAALLDAITAQPQQTVAETKTDDDPKGKACRERALQKLRDAGINCDNIEWHHIYPQEFRPEFGKIGIDVDKWAIPLCAEDHRGKDAGIHRKDADYNGRWHDFFYFDDPTLDRPLTKKEAKAKSSDAVDLATELLNDEGKAGPEYEVCPYKK